MKNVITTDKVLEYIRYLAKSIDKLQDQITIQSVLCSKLTHQAEISAVLMNAMAELLIEKGVFIEKELQLKCDKLNLSVLEERIKINEKVMEDSKLYELDRLMHSKEYGNA